MVTKLSLLLVIISSIIHPLWNILLKKSEDKVIFYLNIHLIFTLMFSFTLFFYNLKEITLWGWILVAFSAFAHFLYQIFLCRTYELTDLSLTYPIVRCSPVFVLILGIFFLREVPSKEALMGIVIVILGVQIIKQQSLSFVQLIPNFRGIKWGILGSVVLTAFFSGCYSIIDKKAVLFMDPFLFFYLFFAFSGFLFLAYFLTLKKRRKHYFRILDKDKSRICVAAILEFASYILILYAFRLSKAAYVIALRQLSVVFGSLFGIWFLKEGYGRVRIIGSLIIFAGIFLITVFG